MSPKEVFTLSFDALSERKARTSLTVLMVVVGSSLMVILNGMSAGQLAFMENQLNQLADNVITVTPGQRSFRSVDSGASIILTNVVVQKIESLPFVREVVPIYSGSVDLNTQGNVVRSTVNGLNSDKIRLMIPNLELVENSKIKANDASAILVGHTIANPDGATIPVITVGQTIKATYTFTDDNGEQQEDSRVFSVSGIIEETGNRQIDRVIFINEPIANAFLQKSGRYNTLWVVVESSDLVNVVEGEIRKLYGNSIGISTAQSSLQFRQNFLGGLNGFILSIGIIALFVGAVGIITTLYTSVTERIKEIGTMKAIGAQSTTIMSLFLVEALMIGILGATFGVIIGITAGYGLSSVIGSPLPIMSDIAPVYVPADLVRVWFLAVGLSIAAGLFPAWKASKLSPLIALRRE
jgi:putative ABC transport system permease protein